MPCSYVFFYVDKSFGNASGDRLYFNGMHYHKVFPDAPHVTFWSVSFSQDFLRPDFGKNCSYPACMELWKRKCPVRRRFLSLLTHITLTLWTTNMLPCSVLTGRRDFGVKKLKTCCLVAPVFTKVSCWSCLETGCSWRIGPKNPANCCLYMKKNKKNNCVRGYAMFA